jgi:signal transduction histidine kinase
VKLRTRLTLLYVVPFLASGAILVSVPLLGASRTAPVGSGEAPHTVVESTVVDRATGFAVVAFAAMVVVSVLLGWFVAGRFLRPLWTITATARDISARNLHRRLGVAGRDEFGQLANTLDDLFERLEAAFESQRRFVANASHELRTPLTAERTLLQVALADPDASVDSLRAACQDVLALGRAQERLIDALLTLAASERGIEQREPFDLAEIAGEVVMARTGTLDVATTLAPAEVSGDPRLMEILVANLVENALRHNVADGRVEVTTWSADGRARLIVRNTGPVVPADEVERLFEPFQRLAGERTSRHQGYGLGLAIVRAIATAHDAAVTAEPLPGGGLAVTVLFP